MPLVKNKPIQSVNSPALHGFTSRSLIIIVAFGILLVSSVGIAIYFYLQYQQTQAQLSKSMQAGEQAALVSEVGKLIMLPSGEQPTVATVSDITRLKSQSFFAHARNGDKVLIYTKAQEAILYDPLANKIVSVGPIALTQTASTSATTATSAAQLKQTQARTVKVVLYNGTATVGLTATIAQELKSKMPAVTVVSRDNAQKSTYTGTLVVDLTGKNAVQAAALAKTLNGKVGKLPVGEIKPKNADLLVILGKS